MTYYFIEEEMQKALEKAITLFTKNPPPQKRSARKPWGQSLVEVAIAFPVLIMLLTGVIEFGFILNYYLSLVDATRDAARYWSNGDPFVWDPDPTEAPYGADTFYYETARDVVKILDPVELSADYVGRRIILDPTVDDVIVSVYGANEAGTVIDWRVTDGLTSPYHLFPSPGHATGNYSSIFTLEDIKNTRVANAPPAGFLLVEVHYNYHHILNLPWMTAWLPNPLHLQAYTIMPIRAAEY